MHGIKTIALPFSNKVMQDASTDLKRKKKREKRRKERSISRSHLLRCKIKLYHISRYGMQLTGIYNSTTKNMMTELRPIHDRCHIDDQKGVVQVLAAVFITPKP